MGNWIPDMFDSATNNKKVASIQDMFPSAKEAAAEDYMCRAARDIINSRMALNEQLFADNADHDNIMQIIKATNRHMSKHNASCTECRNLQGE